MNSGEVLAKNLISMASCILVGYLVVKQATWGFSSKRSKFGPKVSKVM